MKRKRRPAATHGICIIDKPTGITSHDVVVMIRRRFHERQVGHSGTLDPSAAGVLVVAVGKATKLLRFVEKTKKVYLGEIVLGTETTTLDAVGEVIATHDMSGVTLEQAQKAVADHLTGEIEQVPPMVSAIKIGGRRLYELAREGKEVERPSRLITVYSFQLMPTGDPLVFLAAVECSPGTYIRALAADLGQLLGGGAHLRSLRRTAVGCFTIGEAAPPDEATLLPTREAVRTLPQVDVVERIAVQVANGRPQPAWEGEGPWAVFDHEERLLAVYERVGESAKPLVVLPP